MSLDFRDDATFTMWREQFMNALSGSASSDAVPTGQVVINADNIAQEAVELIQQRAREAGR
jgi:hypothetical protein